MCLRAGRATPRARAPHAGAHHIYVLGALAITLLVGPLPCSDAPALLLLVFLVRADMAAVYFQSQHVFLARADIPAGCWLVPL